MIKSNNCRHQWNGDDDIDSDREKCTAFYHIFIPSTSTTSSLTFFLYAAATEVRKQNMSVFVWTHFFVLRVSVCECFCVLYWMDSIYNWMLSSLTIILPSMTTFFTAAAALNDYYLLFCLFYVSHFFVLFLPSCVTIYAIFAGLFSLFCHCSRSVLYCFPTFFIISLCVVSLFFCLFFLCHSVNSPFFHRTVLPLTWLQNTV